MVFAKHAKGYDAGRKSKVKSQNRELKDGIHTIRNRENVEIREDTA